MASSAKKSAPPSPPPHRPESDPPPPPPGPPPGPLLPLLADFAFGVWFGSLAFHTLGTQPVVACGFAVLALMMVASAAALNAGTPKSLFFTYIAHSILFGLLVLVLVLTLVMVILSDFAGDRVLLGTYLLIVLVAGWLTRCSTRLLRHAREKAAGLTGTNPPPPPATQPRQP